MSKTKYVVRRGESGMVELRREGRDYRVMRFDLRRNHWREASLPYDHCSKSMALQALEAEEATVRSIDLGE
jgi:hypothetical protein